MSVFGAYVLKTWCVHLLQVHGVNMQSGELGIGGCVASNLGRASEAQASRVVLGAATSCCYVLLAATRCCYVLLGAATIFHSVLLLLLGVAS